MFKVNWDKMTVKEKEFVNDSIQVSVLDIVRSSEADAFIAEGVIELIKNINQIIEAGTKVLGHNCNEQCKMAVGDHFYRCCKLSNLKITTDNTNYIFKPLTNDYSIECLDQLIEIGLVEARIITKEGYVKSFISSDTFFHPKQHTFPTNTMHEINISPVEGYIFAICQNMQNIQWLTQCGGVNTYIVK